MKPDNSLEALFNPGEASNFFDIKNLPAFEPTNTMAFSRTNALWLSEFCRLIYRQEKDEISTRPDTFLTRDHFLSLKGWRQVPADFFNVKNTQAGIFTNQSLRCAALIFRGTLGSGDMGENLEFIPEPWEGEGLVHKGFTEELRDVWTPIKQRLSKIGVPVVFTGHSLGAALATMASALWRKETNGTAPRALYSFGSPRVGNAAFGQMLGGLFHCRVVNDKDIVPTLPPRNPLFHHTGQLHHIKNGRVHIHQPNEDLREEDGLAGFASMVENSTKTIFENLFHQKKIPPQMLSDHAPVNYTARLESSSLK